VYCPSNDDYDTEQSSNDNDEVIATITDDVYPSQNTEGVPKVHVQDNDNCDALLDSQLVTGGLVDAPSKSLHLPNAEFEITEEVVPTDSPPPNVDLDNTQEVTLLIALLPVDLTHTMIRMRKIVTATHICNSSLTLQPLTIAHFPPFCA